MFCLPTCTFAVRWIVTPPTLLLLLPPPPFFFFHFLWFPFIYILLLPPPFSFPRRWQVSAFWMRYGKTSHKPLHPTLLLHRFGCLALFAFLTAVGMQAGSYALRSLSRCLSIDVPKALYYWPPGGPPPSHPRCLGRFLATVGQNPREFPNFHRFPWCHLSGSFSFSYFGAHSIDSIPLKMVVGKVLLLQSSTSTVYFSNSTGLFVYLFCLVLFFWDRMSIGQHLTIGGSWPLGKFFCPVERRFR